MWTSTTEDLIDSLEALGLRRGFVVTDPESGELRASSAPFEALAEGILAHAGGDYDRHQGCFFELGRESGHLLGAFVHLTHRGQAAGGLRFWSYRNAGEYVVDGLRLSRGMGQKNALAGLWWGGGKGVIARRPGVDHRAPEVRGAVYRDYGRFITSLKGCYVTAEDVGTTPEDIAEVFRHTRLTTCIPPRFGGSGNPSVLTASGVVVAMEAALEHRSLGELAGKRVAMQGLGNVAGFMIRRLLERSVERIVGVDVDAATVEKVAAEHGGGRVCVRAVEPGDLSIFSEDCDIMAPNAVGACLNPETIPMLRAPIVCGAANNQLAETRRDARALAGRGILYVPDFLANRMGIVNCANEQYGVFEGDAAVAAHLERETDHGIFQRSLEVFRRAEASGRSTAEEAEDLADELAGERHPIWPDRGQRIIDHLVASGWDRGACDPPGLEL